MASSMDWSVWAGGHVLAMGGFLLGAGWALCGACPAIVWVQLGEGRIAGALSLAGILAGMATYPRIHRRLFRWPGDACA